VCVGERQRERVCVCVCEREREREMKGLESLNVSLERVMFA
jgi:hypothetical protein